MRALGHAGDAGGPRRGIAAPRDDVRRIVQGRERGDEAGDVPADTRRGRAERAAVDTDTKTALFRVPAAGFGVRVHVPIRFQVQGSRLSVRGARVHLTAGCAPELRT